MSIDTAKTPADSATEIAQRPGDLEGETGSCVVGSGTETGKGTTDSRATDARTQAPDPVAEARAQAQADAARRAAPKLIAAEFRAAATGKVANPAKVADLLDLTKLADADGNPDDAAIAAAVDALVAAVGVPATQVVGRFPAGPRGDGHLTSTPIGDALRKAARSAGTHHWH